MPNTNPATHVVNKMVPVTADLLSRYGTMSKATSAATAIAGAHSTRQSANASACAGSYATMITPIASQAQESSFSSPVAIGAIESTAARPLSARNQLFDADADRDPLSNQQQHTADDNGDAQIA